jgi:hypothetical protein
MEQPSTTALSVPSPGGQHKDSATIVSAEL